MAVIERHRTLLQRLTGTGHPAGRKPAPSITRVAETKASRFTRPGASPVPTFGKPSTTSRSSLTFVLAAVVVMVLAALATAVMTGIVPADIKARVGKSFNAIVTIGGVLLGLGLTLWVRQLVLKAMSSAASKAWTSIRDSANGKSPWTTDAKRTHASETRHLEPGQAKPAPPLFGIIVGFFVTLWFVMPFWAGLLRNFALHKTPIISWLPLILFALWAWRRLGSKA